MVSFGSRLWFLYQAMAPGLCGELLALPLPHAKEWEEGGRNACGSER